MIYSQQTNSYQCIRDVYKRQALIRALSSLLTYRNGVGVIATHSPVIVQEVPKDCVWILRRVGAVSYTHLYAMYIRRVIHGVMQEMG